MNTESTSAPAPADQIRAWAAAFVREYGEWFVVHQGKWWRRHQLMGTWDRAGAKGLAEMYVSMAVEQLDPDQYEWAFWRHKQPYTISKVLAVVAPLITVQEIPGPYVDLNPEARAYLEQAGKISSQPRASSPPAPPDAARPAPPTRSATDRSPTSPTPGDPGGTGG